MIRDEIFACWAPEGALFSNWVKPVLFAHLSNESAGVDAGPPLGLSAATMFPEPDQKTVAADPHPFRVASSHRDVAVVVDLPGAQGVAAGLELAQLGLRPVPLYNALPGPIGQTSLIDVTPIISALAGGAQRLADLALPSGAPPAFLLDADRFRPRGRLLPGCFDNRSLSHPSDFPSADFLWQAGIRRVVVLQQAAGRPQQDLYETLSGWQRRGMLLFRRSLDEHAPVPLHVGRLALLARLRQRWARFMLRGHPVDGFGGTIPAAGG